ncbi:DsbE family thiol:disulfide interchange protein [Pelagovum pacificum]|uniref:DsbE family thiol:disulfide interchange protein n=1 Tax=Pelagovum pacificum TaxID=2588711 RepID=A0A5C5GEQ1_9RHOB|nr:DsbE family thiol:disulfide interchange protein [Pelagovum pacificum]QQA44452.1 DsbE family thiol:disulfide interchange protein [Pelagovum pacificum]TNY32431.1 DsbE family thiol:disulfide interchange protein [Pelagovum pacificum]
MARIRPLMIAPPVIFAALAGLFAAGMYRDNPDELPSTLIDRPVPDLEGVQLASYPTFSSSDLADGEVKIVNFFASWCPPCRAEHPALMELSEEGVPVYGVNKSDPEDNALAFIEEMGNPYRAIAVDRNGRDSIDWGVVALPETFVVDGDGVIVLKFSGPIHGVMDTIIRPALAEAAE